MQLTEEERKKITSICMEMIEGKLDLIVGSRKLSSISRRVSSVKNEIFYPFIAVDSETDHFPLGKVRNECSQLFLKKSDAEMSEYIEEVGQEIVEACKQLIDFINCE